jgi:DNA replication factor GINS
MNLDELQSVRSRERQTDSPQTLRASFYRDAAEYIEELRRERDRAAERAEDPFASSEVRRLTDDIETARSTVEAIYERRVGKVVKRASIAAAGMPTDQDGLTEEERVLFDALVRCIEENREHVLEDVLAGGGSELSFGRDDSVSGGDPADQAEPTADAPEAIGNPPVIDDDPVDASSVMGGDEADEPPEPTTTGDTEPTGATDPAESEAADSTDEGSDAAEPVNRTTVRITRDVGEIFGVDERAYQLASDDVVTLPSENAEPLLEQDAAEKLE